MDDSLSWAIVGFSGVMLALGNAADSALHHYSHNRLEKLLGEGRRSQRVAQSLKDFDSLLVSLALWNALATVLFFGSIALLRHGPDGPAFTAGRGIGTLAIIFALHGIGICGLVRAVVGFSAERTLLRLLGFIGLAHRVMLPLRVPIEALGRFGGGIAGGNEPSDEHEAVEDILDAVAEGEAEGAIEEGAADFIENIMEYKDRVVREVMTPRTAMVSVRVDTGLDEVLDLVDEHGYSKLPVYEGTRDNIIGVLFLKDLVRRHVRAADGAFDLRALVRKTVFVPETKKVSELLKEFQQQKGQIAIVIDEFGGTSGLVTVEDIVEEIVGELEDEFDSAGEDAAINRLDENNVEVDAKVAIEDLNEMLSIAIPEDGDYETVGGFLSAALGKVPEEGEQFSLQGVSFEVTAADERRVKRVRVTTAPSPATESR